MISKEDVEANMLFFELGELDHKEGTEGLQLDEINRMDEIKLLLARKEKMEELAWKQKSRKKWLKEGDISTKYFHTLANQHRRCNFLEEMWVDGVKHKGNENIGEAAREHLMCLYEEEFAVRPQLDGLNFKKIGGSNRKML